VLIQWAGQDATERLVFMTILY